MDEQETPRCKSCGKPRTSQVFNEDYCAICLAEENIRVSKIYNDYIVSWLKTSNIQDNRTILLWRFHDAPSGLRMLSQNGGDEDWLVYVPIDVELTYFPLWLERIDSCEEPDEFTLPNGARVYIGSH